MHRLIGGVRQHIFFIRLQVDKFPRHAGSRPTAYGLRRLHRLQGFIGGGKKDGQAMVLDLKKWEMLFVWPEQTIVWWEQTIVWWQQTIVWPEQTTIG